MRVLFSIACITALLGCSSSSPVSGSTSAIAPGPGGSGSGSGSGSSRASEGAPGAPEAYITSTIGPESVDGGTSTCNITSPAPFFSVGSLTAPVASGATYEGAPITVTCQVYAAGAGYSTQLNVSYGEQYAIQITGTLTDSPGATQTGVNATFSSATAQYASNGPGSLPCTVVLTTQAPGGVPITAGRVWGQLTCPAVTDPESNSVCAATATFVFENCQE